MTEGTANLESQSSKVKGEGRGAEPEGKGAGPPGLPPQGSAAEAPWNGFRVRLWLPVTLGRPHAGAVGDYATAYELARAKEGGGHHPDADFDVVLVEIEYPGRRAE